MDENVTKTEETFKDRLLREKQELEDKLQKLTAFQVSEAFGKIEPIQMTLLNVQAEIMKSYAQVLAERITWLSRELTPPQSNE